MAIKHNVIPTGSHEKRAEAHFSWLSKAMDAMLFEARLSPIFWADAAKYACYLHNRLPCMKHGSTPFTKVTGKPTEWGHIRKFGSSAVRLIMNDKLAKYPGMPRGEHMIFRRIRRAQQRLAALRSDDTEVCVRCRTCRFL